MLSDDFFHVRSPQNGGTDPFASGLAAAGVLLDPFRKDGIPFTGFSTIKHTTGGFAPFYTFGNRWPHIFPNPVNARLPKNEGTFNKLMPSGGVWINESMWSG